MRAAQLARSGRAKGRRPRDGRSREERRPTVAPESRARCGSGVIDAGANTLRLLVAREKRGALSRRVPRSACGSASARRSSGSAASRTTKLAERRHRRGRARPSARATLRCDRLEVLVTSPGRQSAQLRRAVEPARARDRRARAAPERRGGGRARLRGRRRRLPQAAEERRRVRRRRRLDAGRRRHAGRRRRLGALVRHRLAAAHAPLARRRPAREDSRRRRARLEAARGARAGWSRPLPKAALAVGGSARAVAKIVGRSARRGGARARHASCSPRGAARRSRRASGSRRSARETLLAGAIILAEVQRRLGVPFRLGTRRHPRGRRALELLAERLAA